MAASDERAPWFTRILGSGAVAAVVAYVFYMTPFYERSCGSELAAKSGAAAEWLCREEDQRISDAAATEYVDSLLARVRGTQREGTVESLMTDDTPRARADAAAWRAVIYAVRIDPIHRTSNHNEFTTRIRRFSVRHPQRLGRDNGFYADDLGLDEMTLTVRLTETDSGPMARRIILVDRNPLGTFTQRRAGATVLTDYYRRTVRADDGHHNLGPPDSIWEICQKHVADSPDEWWASTYLGWVPHADLEGGDVEVAGVEPCEPAAP